MDTALPVGIILDIRIAPGRLRRFNEVVLVVWPHLEDCPLQVVF